MNNIKILYNKYFVLFIHLGVWGILFFSPYLLFSGQTQLTDIIERSWIPLLFYVALFYINYFILIKKFIFTGRILLFTLINIIIISFFVWIKHEYIFNIFMENRPRPPMSKHAPSLSFFIYVDSLSMIIPVVFAIAFRVVQRWLKTEAEKKEIENIKLQAELQHLRYQLQPHFFFNSLNNIYSLVDISPEKAKETLHSLSKLMRYLLYDSNAEKVSLHKEIEFMNKYIELMKLRLTEKTKVITSFPNLDTSIQVPPLLFISIIENAFKHGISATHESELEFILILEDDEINFLSRNKNFPKSAEDKSGSSGIGIQNLQKRLELLYPKKYTYTSKVEDNKFTVFLNFKLN